MGARSAAPNLMIKVPATPRGHRRRSAQLIARRHQRQRHAALRAGCLRAGRGGLHRRARSAGRRAAAIRQRVASVASFFVSRIDTAVDALIDDRLPKPPTTARERAAPAWRCAARWRSPTPSSPTSGISELFSSPRWQRAGRARRADAAPAVGQHRHQERQLSRRGLRRGADRARHGQHDPAADARPRSAITGGRARASPRTSRPRATRCARSPRPASR